MPLSLTPALEDAIIEAVAHGTTLTSAARIAGMSTNTIREWAHISEQGRWSNGEPASDEAIAISARFVERLALARAQFEASVTANLAKAGFRELKSGSTDWRAHLELLKHHPEYRERWREHKELKVEHRGSVGIEHHQVREMDDASLLELVSPEIAGLLEGPSE